MIVVPCPRLHDDDLVAAIAIVVAFATVVGFASNQKRIFNSQPNQYGPEPSQYFERPSIRYVKS
jgi:hypothetical protein